jgi:hypothetical protein
VALPGVTEWLAEQPAWCNPTPLGGLTDQFWTRDRVAVGRCLGAALKHGRESHRDNTSAPPQSKNSGSHRYACPIIASVSYPPSGWISPASATSATIVLRPL